MRMKKRKGQVRRPYERRVVEARARRQRPTLGDFFFGEHVTSAWLPTLPARKSRCSL